jgi:hypothetical protein
LKASTGFEDANKLDSVNIVSERCPMPLGQTTHTGLELRPARLQARSATNELRELIPVALTFRYKYNNLLTSPLVSLCKQYN